jgi:hypothetical protein
MPTTKVIRQISNLPSRSARRARVRRARQSAAAAPQKVATTTVVTTAGPSRRRRQRRRGARARAQAGGLRGAAAHYAIALNDPFNIAAKGARIPDPSSIPTSTFTLEREGFAFTDSSGQLAFCYTPADFPNYVNYSSVNGGAIGSVGVYTLPASGAYVNSAQQWQQYGSIQALYSAIRLVGAGVCLRYTGNTAADAGVICMGINQATTNAANLATYLSTNGINFTMQNAQSQIVPLKDGLTCTWRFNDNSDWEFQTTNPAAPLGMGNSIMVNVSGAAVSTQCIYYKLIAHYEGIPFPDTARFVSPTPSPADIVGAELATSVAAQTSPFKDLSGMGPGADNPSGFGATGAIADFAWKALYGAGSLGVANLARRAYNSRYGMGPAYSQRI